MPTPLDRGGPRPGWRRRVLLVAVAAMLAAYAGCDAAPVASPPTGTAMAAPSPAPGPPSPPSRLPMPSLENLPINVRGFPM